MAFLVPRCPLLLLACGLGACAGAETNSRLNVVLVTIDTLRADHCSGYGYGHRTTPRLDGLAAQGVRFAAAYTPAPVTGPSHASLLTSQYPQHHGVLRNGDTLSPRALTLAEVLQDAGYRTAAVVSAYPLKAKFGLAQGFRVYEDDFRAPDASLPRPRWEGRPLGESYDCRAWATSGLALAWLARQAERERAFFLWVHYFDPHTPYDAPEVPEDAAAFDGYDREIRYADQELGRVLDFIDASPRLAATTVVIVAGDHGEGLGQHGQEQHGEVVYEEAVRVPLVLRFPGAPRGGRVWEDAVTLLDVAPTVLGLLRLGGRPEPFLGRDLSAPLEGRPGRIRTDPVFLRSEPRPEGCHQQAVRLGRWKYLENRCRGSLRDSELYDLLADPGEAHDQREAEPERMPEMARLLRRWRRSGEVRSGDVQSVPPSAADEDALRALGYF